MIKNAIFGVVILLVMFGTIIGVIGTIVLQKINATVEADMPRILEESRQRTQDRPVDMDYIRRNLLEFDASKTGSAQ